MISENNEKKSTFVTALAWIFIVIGGFSVFITAVQNIMLRLMFSDSDKEKMLAQTQNGEEIPVFAQFMMNHLDLFFAGAFIVSAICLVAAIGLLKRKNWARIIFIVLLSLGIVWNIGGLILQQVMLANMPMNADVPIEHQQQMETMQSFMTIISVVFALAFCGLFGWIIWKLFKPEIVKEFRANNSLKHGTPHSGAP